MKQDELFMSRALELALKGGISVAPNPLVGAVIVHKNTIIGEGFHEFYGGPHAEVNAINSVENKSLLPESSIYVTLEPCAHFGKTPPCANLLIEHRLKRVFIAMRDPFSEVDGKGIELLTKAGIEVIVGILEKEAIQLNKRFLTFHVKKRPYITLKWAQTKDGFIAPESKETANVFWISSPLTQILTHAMRAHEQAILVGWKTVEADNPSLTTRAFPGPNPIRVIIDPNLQSNPKSIVYTDEHKTIVINKLKNEKQNNVQYIQLTQITLKSIVETLADQGIQSVIIEGGQNTLEQFIQHDLWDEALVIVGNSIIENGVKAPQLKKTPIHFQSCDSDKIYKYINKS